MPPSPPSTPALRPFLFASLAGALPALLLFAWMVTAGSFDLTAPQPIGDFYDVQAHRLLDLRWDMPQHVLGLEGFLVDGRWYMYFGPTPSLLRLPVVAATDAFDGRLTQVSMTLAFAVAVVGVTRLHWKVRRRLRGDDPVQRGEAVGIAAFTFLLAAGSSLLYLGSRAWVYHEATLWGIALSLVAFDALFGFLTTGRRRSLAAATAFAALAILARPTVGAAPAVALALLALAAAAARARALAGRLRWAAPPPGTRVVTLVVAVLVPVALYAWVNWSKFDVLFGIPLDRQHHSFFDARRQAALADNGGSLFGLKFVPTTLWQYVRPDALAIDRLFPWITFPAFRASVIGGVTFDTLDRASSVTATLPALVGLAGVGVTALVRPARAGVERVAALRPLVVAAAAGPVGVLAIAFVAHRYTADAFPLLVLPALVGFQYLARGLAGSPALRLRVLAGLLVALGLWTAYANFALAVWYQRAYSNNVAEPVRAELLELQDRVDRALFGGGLRPRRGTALPEQGRDGDLFVIGDCEGLYWHDGEAWRAVERTPATGHFRLRLRLGPMQPGHRRGLQPLLSSGEPGTGDGRFLAFRRPRPDRLEFAYSADFPGPPEHVGQPVEVDADAPITLDVVMDRRTRELRVMLDRRIVFQYFYFAGSDRFRLGRAWPGAPVTERLDGHVAALPVGAPLCQELASRTGTSS